MQVKPDIASVFVCTQEGVMESDGWLNQVLFTCFYFVASLTQNLL